MSLSGISITRDGHDDGERDIYVSLSTTAMTDVLSRISSAVPPDISNQI